MIIENYSSFEKFVLIFICSMTTNYTERLVAILLLLVFNIKKNIMHKKIYKKKLFLFFNAANHL